MIDHLSELLRVLKIFLALKVCGQVLWDDFKGIRTVYGLLFSKNMNGKLASCNRLLLVEICLSAEGPYTGNTCFIWTVQWLVEVLNLPSRQINKLIVMKWHWRIYDKLLMKWTHFTAHFNYSRNVSPTKRKLRSSASIILRWPSCFSILCDPQFGCFYVFFLCHLVSPLKYFSLVLHLFLPLNFPVITGFSNFFLYEMS